MIRNQLSELEISRDEVEKKLESIQKQNRSSNETNKIHTLTETNNHLLEEINILKSNIDQLHQQIQQMDEREQMLLQYPDLNGPIEHESSKMLYLSLLLIHHIFCLGTNNIIIDMQNQMRTNEIRIDLLRKQNDSLKSSLEKLLSMNNNNNYYNNFDDHNQSSITEERYEELRNQSRPEQPQRRYSYGNEAITPVFCCLL